MPRTANRKLRVVRMDPPPSRSPMALFVCPLCLEESAGTARVAIVAEFDLTTSLVTVGDLSGCRHAAAFGAVGVLSLDQERRMIEAALRMWEAGEEEQPPGSSSRRSAEH